MYTDNLTPIARNTDPSTSHKAARELTKSGTRDALMQQIFTVIEDTPGLITGEIGDLLGLSMGQVSKRLSDLKNAELVVMGEETRRWEGSGKDQSAWYIAPEKEVATEMTSPTIYAPPTPISPPNVKAVDINSIPYLVHMTRTGIKIDPSKFAALSHQFAIRIQEEETAAWLSVNEPFNLGSDEQVAKILFIKLGLSPSKKTKGGGWSVDESVLEEIKDQHPIIPHILERRRLSKLKGTYTDGLPKKMSEDGRIYARWNGAFVETGRLSCRDPNLTTIPARDEEAKDIKKAFVASDGFIILGEDYGQIELRTAAHISQDKGMMDAFWRGEDIHTATAMDAFYISSPDDVSYVQRRDAKILNFGVLFGLTPFGLLNNIPVEERDPNIHTKQWAEDFIARYFTARPGLAKYIDETKAFVRRYGYVHDVFGRIRWIPEIASSQGRIRAEGERNAINMPIQATAAGIIRVAMGMLLSVNGKKGALDGYVKANLVKPILQVHDALYFEVYEPIWRDVANMVKIVMERAAPWLTVPLIADVEAGPSWGEMEKVVL